MKKITLSILITTHNNEQQIARCMDSVLAQQIDVPYEIIVSDDSSTDGTMAILRKYEKEHAGLVHVYSVCSDDIHPTMGLERAGWNKANVYMHAKGEYVVNLDGDDYLLGTDIYQKQIEMLEQHPECVACMQNLLMVEEGKRLEFGTYWRQYDLKDGDVISFEDYILNNRSISHPAFMFRRDKELDAVKRYGKFFDDEFNVMHHLQKGNIVYLHRADYVYVQHDKSINHSYVSKSRNARYICLPVIYGIFWPEFRYLFLKGYLNTMQSNLKQFIANAKGCVQNDVIGYLSQFKARIVVHVAKSRSTVLDRLYMKIVWHYVLVLNKYKPRKDMWYRILHRMLV